MSAYDEARIEKPRFFGLRPLKQGRGKRVPCVIGFDSEADTRTGEPMLLQFSTPGMTADETTLLIVPEGDRRQARGKFLAWIAVNCSRKDTEYVIYGWNLEYEFTQLFGDLDDEVRNSGDFEINTTIDYNGQEYRFGLHVMNDKRHLMTILNRATRRQIRFLDGMAFYKTGLDNAAKMLGVGGKYVSGDLDRALFTRDDLNNEEFLRYARMDAFITRRVGEFIIDQHETYDVTTCISAPHFASTVFRKNFLDGEIELPAPDLEQAGLWSYHGGKNGFYLDGPRHIDNIWECDITSAYPEAMRAIPDPVRASWHEVADYRPGRHAIYRVTLQYRSCAYRGMMSFDGLWPDAGYIEDVYLTGYELDAMMERNECDILTVRGWEMTGDPGGSLVKYVDTFFAQKRIATGPERDTAKLFLNSLYGKFFQKVALGTVGALDLDTGEWIETDPTSPYDWRAGGLYHPPIASLITGFVRAKIHRLEHRYESVMTSTDGIFAMLPPDVADLGDDLGMLTARPGKLDIWRERLYVFEPHDGGKPKIALHGFRAGRDVLATIPLERGKYGYTARSMMTLKMSTREQRGERYTPGRFVDLPYEIVI